MDRLIQQLEIVAAAAGIARQIQHRATAWAARQGSSMRKSGEEQRDRAGSYISDLFRPPLGMLTADIRLCIDFLTPLLNWPGPNPPPRLRRITSGILGRVGARFRISATAGVSVTLVPSSPAEGLTPNGQAVTVQRKADNLVPSC